MVKSILVTGSAGFVGSHLVDRLLDTGYIVTGYDCFNDFYDLNVKWSNTQRHMDHTNFKLVKGDIRDSQRLKDAFRSADCDTVIHLAAMAGVRAFIRHPELYSETNVTGTLNVLEACRIHAVDHFVFASSSSVYGNSRSFPLSETNDADSPISPYAATKRAGELLVQTYHRLYDIRTACLRFFTVFGPRQRPDMAISSFIDCVIKDREIPVHGDGRSFRDYTFITDIVNGVLLTLEADFDCETVNLGSSTAISLSDVIRSVEHHLQKRARLVKLSVQDGDVGGTHADISKARRLLGYNPTVQFDTGIKHQAEWAQLQEGNRRSATNESGATKQQ